MHFFSILLRNNRIFDTSACVATFGAKMLQHVQVIYFVIRCEAKFSRVRLDISSALESNAYLRLT